MPELETAKALLDALRQASSHNPTAEELQRQRVSFIMGSLKPNSSVTRDRVQKVLEQQEGRKGPP